MDTITFIVVLLYYVVFTYIIHVIFDVGYVLALFVTFVLGVAISWYTDRMDNDDNY